MSAHASEKDAAAMDEKVHPENNANAVPENAKIVEAENTDCVGFGDWTAPSATQ